MGGAQFVQLKHRTTADIYASHKKLYLLPVRFLSYGVIFMSKLDFFSQPTLHSFCYMYYVVN